jgi:predicted RND superfamily exporter protein
MHQLFQFILKKPVLVMAFIVAIFLSAAVGLKNFKLDASSDALVIEGDEAFKVYRETGEIFGNSDFLIITFTPETDLFSPQSLATIKSLDTQLEKLPGVQSVLTILDAPIFFQPKVPIADLMDNLKTLESEDIDFLAAKEEIIDNPVYSELIISPDGGTTAIQVTLRENSLYRDLITKRYELLAFNNISSTQKNELNNINKQISQINDDEAKQAE